MKTGEGREKEGITEQEEGEVKDKNSRTVFNSSQLIYKPKKKY